MASNFDDYIKLIHEQFKKIIDKGIPLFQTDVHNLFEAFLEEIPHESRQKYTCSECKKFVNKYGNIVGLTDKGKVESALWGDFDGFLAPAFKRIKNLVESAKIVDVFMTSKEILGVSRAGGFNHMHVVIPDKIRYMGKINTDLQMVYQKREDYRILQSYIEEYPSDVVTDASNILNSEHLYRFEKCIGVCNWFSEIHNKLNTNRIKRNNVIWYAVATAPPGYCHIKNTMIGTLLDDILYGFDFESIAERFAEKMDPLMYQRPRSKPTIGNVEQGEKIVEKLGIQKSFSRRFARLEELNTIWKNKELTTPGTGFFKNIRVKTKDKFKKSLNIPATKITWKKFEETVLHNANKIELLVPERGNFSAILTATHEDAPPILQWDNMKNRNPFSWYVYANGSLCTRWNLKPEYCNVTGICYQPSMWYCKYPHHGKGIFFIIEDAKEMGETSGSCLFPEMLNYELREIRKTIEAYSKQAELGGKNEASACGLKATYGREWNIQLRVTTSTGIFEYILDRWD